MEVGSDVGDEVETVGDRKFGLEVGGEVGFRYGISVFKIFSRCSWCDN